MSSPQRRPQNGQPSGRYSGTGKYSNYSSRRRRKKKSHFASIVIIVLVCICFLALSFILLKNKDNKDGESSSGDHTSTSQQSSADTGTSSQEEVSSVASENEESIPQNESSSSKTVSVQQDPTAAVADPLGGVPTGELCPLSFFDDAIFVGDSVIMQLGNYVGQNGALGNALMAGVGNYSVTNALRPVNENDQYPHHKIGTKEYQTQDYIYEKNKTKPLNKAFIMFGTNDLNLYKTYDDFLAKYKEYLDKITEKNPQLTIYLMATTPVTKAYSDKNSKGKLNQKGIDGFNVELKKFCEENGYQFINTNSVLRDTNGCLKADEASGDGFHPNNAGYAELVETIRIQVG